MPQEQLEYGDVKVPIYRQNCAEIYIALQPPQATPYIVAPHNAQVQDIIDYYVARREVVEELQAKMLKRFQKSSSERCSYQTGDIAYVMGRPFMLQVHPLGKKTAATGGTRGRASVKYSVDTGVSLLTLFVVKPKDYDQCKASFLIYGRQVIMANAPKMAASCLNRIAPDAAVPQVRMREMSGRFSKLEAGCLWLSTDLVPYPVDCLVYAIWHELLGLATIPEEEARAHMQSVIPGWEHAAELLSTRAKPYSNQ